jgi:mannitol/fructose-specific phosphotransferase system IIA component (Ntr-type)
LINYFIAGACFPASSSYRAHTVSSPTELIAEPDAVVLDLEAETGEAAVRLLHRRLTEASEAISNPPDFLRDILQRMQEAPTGIADDVALPHARTNAVSRIVVGVARTRNPVPFDAGHPGVRLIFLIGTPKNEVTGYLKVVARLSRALRNPAIRAGLYSATDEAEFRALLSGGVAARR